MKVCGFCLLLLCFLSSCGEEPAPIEPSGDEQPPGAYFIGMETMRQLVLAKAQVIDVRGRSLFSRLHFPGAIHVDWKTFTIGDDSGILLPLPELMEKVTRLNLDESRDVVIVGQFQDGWGEEGRIAWLLRGMGLKRVFILKGGFVRWESMGGAGSAGLSVPLRGSFKPREPLAGNITADEVAAAEGALILDTRAPSEFAGGTPYGSTRGGNIDGAFNLPFDELFKGRTLLSLDEIRSFSPLKGVASDRAIIVYCTGGIRSAFVACALSDAGFTNVRNYSGSWWEWSTR